MTTGDGTFASERAEYLSLLGLGIDIPSLTLAQLKVYASMNSQERQSNPALFDSSGNLRLDAGNVVADTLSVANFVAATAVGVVNGKIQVFDNNGNALGFVPVYATIT